MTTGEKIEQNEKIGERTSTEAMDSAAASSRARTTTEAGAATDNESNQIDAAAAVQPTATTNNITGAAKNTVEKRVEVHSSNRSTREDGNGKERR